MAENARACKKAPRPKSGRSCRSFCATPAWKLRPTSTCRRSVPEARGAEQAGEDGPEKSSLSGL